MRWELSAEYLACIIICIIMVYSYNGSMLPTIKNKTFHFCLAVSLGSIFSNIVSTLMLNSYQMIPHIPMYIITIIYFIFTPLMGMVYFFYTVCVVYDEKEKIFKIWKYSAVFYLIYLGFIVTNPIFHSLFTIDRVTGYSRGSCIVVTYLLFYLYCIMCFVLIIIRRNYIDKTVRNILLSFPFIALIAILLQQVLKNVILTGAAACSALLIIYLYLQNKQISQDYLTGLSNRQEFLKMLEIRLKEKKSDVFAIVVISLNNFKMVNKKYGQQKGDVLLQQISNYLKSIMPITCLYRYNGDQFAIVMEKVTDDSVKKLLNDLFSRFQRPWEAKPYSCVISASIGITSYPHSAQEMEGIISGIEYAVAIARKGNGTTYQFCSKSMLEEMRRKNDIIDIMKERLKDDGFEVYLQPIYSVNDKSFKFAEALLRLNGTKYGNISPGEFIPIAEETGQILDITYMVLDKVCKIIKEMLDHGRVVDRIAVNFPAVQFLEEHLEEKIIGTAKKYKIPPSKIKIEITESTLISSFDRIKEFSERMNEYGIGFGLDDFGTGYSNITSVLCGTFDTIKLDKSLIWSSMINEKSASVVRYLSKGIREVGMNLLAEGVETKEQEDFVNSCGCDYIQGFLFAKPMPYLEAESFFEYCEID